MLNVTNNRRSKCYQKLLKEFWSFISHFTVTDLEWGKCSKWLKLQEKIISRAICCIPFKVLYKDLRVSLIYRHFSYLDIELAVLGSNVLIFFTVDIKKSDTISPFSNICQMQKLILLSCFKKCLLTTTFIAFCVKVFIEHTERNTI